MNSPFVKKAASVLIAASLTSSCSSMHDFARDYGTAAGCIGGAALGGGITYLVTHDAKKALVGGLAGGVAGCAVGNVWQSREQALEKIAQEEKIRISTEALRAQENSKHDQVGFVAQVEDGSMFNSGSADLTSAGLRQVQKIAAAMRSGQQDDKGVLLVVGHTDATGSPAYNQQLSEARAHNVGLVLEQSGIKASQLYFQGVGSSRPLANNDSDSGRAQNRRVEIVALANEGLLRQRLALEDNNPRYLRYSSAAENTLARTAQPKKKTQTTTKKTPVASTQVMATPMASAVVTNPANFIDFGGSPASTHPTGLASNLKPLSQGFSLISQAQASNVAGSCLTDLPRVSGLAKNLASGQPVEKHETQAFLPNMNGRAWAGLVNGNLVTLTPVSVLKDGAKVTKNPQIIITPDYAQGKRTSLTAMSGIANSWEGEDSILYRVYIENAQQQPVSCLDLLLPKSGHPAQQGQLFYSNHRQPWLADYAPQRG
ncbi:OmpA family protein [Pantoea cypripedii]|uniref:OmpA family protein n=1 Tax=Pantoea cypripedii TaxID=55209 RepID=A0A6B9G4A6_PANCY|nr:OmpA family protein [Pantoea cypripedii]QGY31848.1 OmpA family protein [Pantoea cypripedii]